MKAIRDMVSGVAGKHKTDDQPANVHTDDVAPDVTPDMAVTEESVAVGLPSAEQGTGVASFKDAFVTEEMKNLAVTDIKDEVISGHAINMETKEVEVPVTEMVKETIQVPGTHMETQRVEKPVTITEKVPQEQKEVVMRDEVVTREEVVLEHSKVDKPVTVMKPVHTEKPIVVPRPVMVARPNEVMKKITVVRPENMMEEVIVERPVEVKRKIKVMRPVTTKRTITIQEPVPTAEKVNITVPEIRDASMTIQVPHDERESVNVKVPVTVIRSEKEKVIKPVEATRDIKQADLQSAETRDWASIPVGLPFTELVTRSRDMSVTTLHDEKVDIRQTWMQPKQFKKVGYKMVSKKVVILETEMKEVEEEVTETEMKPFPVEMMVTVMNEAEEEWPVSHERQEEVLISSVTLEPVTTMVPEIGVETVDVDVPRTIQHTETIQHPETVTKTVMVDQPRTVMQTVETEVPVEHMDDVEIEKPVTRYEKRTVQVPTSGNKDVTVQKVSEREEEVREQFANTSTGHVAYRTAETVMKPTAVRGHVVVEENVGIAQVRDVDLAKTAEEKAHGLVQQEGVFVPNPQTDKEADGLMVGVKPAAHVTPDAILPGGIASVVRQTGVDGQLVGNEYIGDIRDQIKTSNVQDGVVTDATYYGGVEKEVEIVRDTFVTTEHVDEEKKKGLLGRMKNKMQNK